MTSLRGYHHAGLNRQVDDETEADEEIRTLDPLLRKEMLYH